MITNKKLNSVSLAWAALILFLILFSSTASAATSICNVKGTNYQYWSGEQYPSIDLFGDQYVPLLEENDQIWESYVDKLTKIVVDTSGNYYLKAGESLDIGQGYSLQVKQVDVDGKKVWLEFNKNSQYIADQIISTDSGYKIWNCTLNNIQGVNNVTVFKVHVNQVSQGVTDSVVQIDGIWLIDYENATTLQIGDQFGGYALTTIINGTDASNLGSLVFEYMVTITDLGTLGGSNSYAEGINDKGQIVGYSDIGTGEYHAFLWQNGIMTDIGTLGGSFSRACGINENGQVVGYSDIGTGDTHAFLWQNGMMTDLGTLGGLHSFAYGINNRGQVIGYSETVPDEYHAFLWQNGMMTDIKTLLRGSNSWAEKINNKGQIVGYSDIGNGNVHAFLWQNDVITDIGTLPGGYDSNAWGINNNEQVVGCSGMASGETHAFLWQNDVMTDIGALGGSDSWAEEIDDNGRVVGYSDIGAGHIHAFLWQNDVMTDIGTLFNGEFSSAAAINENGQIVGWSETGTGENHAALWTVTPPNTKPLANFSVSPIVGKVPLVVKFTDESTGSPTSWNWNFGDRTANSTDQNPVHLYEKAGKFTVTLTVENVAGSNTTKKLRYVTVKMR